LTGKDADLWDGKHRSDSQTLGGDITIGNTLKINGNKIKDSNGWTRIAFYPDETYHNFAILAYGSNERIYEIEFRSTENAVIHTWRNFSTYDTIMTLDQEGDLWIAGTLSQGCLREFKKDIAFLEDVDFIDVVKKLNPVAFKLKNDSNERVGFIADDAPEEFKVYRNGKLVGIDIMAILTYLVGAVKQLSQRVKNA